MEFRFPHDASKLPSTGLEDFLQIPQGSSDRLSEIFILFYLFIRQELNIGHRVVDGHLRQEKRQEKKSKGGRRGKKKWIGAKSETFHPRPCYVMR